MQYVKLDKKQIFPSKIICIGRNYVDHIEELDNEIPTELVVFMKPNSAISNEVYFNDKDAVHFEGEITFMIKNKRIFAVGFGLDLTKRDLQQKLKVKGLPWERAKSFNRSAVFSEFIHFEGNIQNLRMEFYINDVLTQQGGYELMLHKPNNIIKEVNSFVTFEDGDLLMTGTPKGVAAIKIGDTYVGRIFEQEKLLVEASWAVK